MAVPPQGLSRSHLLFSVSDSVFPLLTAEYQSEMLGPQRLCQDQVGSLCPGLGMLVSSEPWLISCE